MLCPLGDELRKHRVIWETGALFSRKGHSWQGWHHPLYISYGLPKFPLHNCTSASCLKASSRFEFTHSSREFRQHTSCKQTNAGPTRKPGSVSITLRLCCSATRFFVLKAGQNSSELWLCEENYCEWPDWWEWISAKLAAPRPHLTWYLSWNNSQVVADILRNCGLNFRWSFSWNVGWDDLNWHEMLAEINWMLTELLPKC